MTRDFQQCGMCDQQRLRPACTYGQSDQSLCWSLEYSMTVMLLTEQRLEFLSLKGGCTGSSESTLVKMPHCWKSHLAAQLYFIWLYIHISFCVLFHCFNKIKLLLRFIIETFFSNSFLIPFLYLCFCCFFLSKSRNA